MTKTSSFWALALFALLAACGSDDITNTDDNGGGSSSGSDNPYSEVNFDRTVTVTFGSGTATVSGIGSGQTATIDGNGVTIVNTSDEKVEYVLGGNTDNGYLKIYSVKKQAIVLNGVSITNPNGAAVNIQGSQASPNSGKCAYIVLCGDNTLADGSSYTNTPDNEDEKAVLFSEGQLIFSTGSTSNGTLTVTACGKSGIVSDDYVQFDAGTVNVNMTSACKVSNGDTLKPACIKGKDAFYMNGGTLNLSSTGTGAKGISGDSIAVFNGGTVNITVTGTNFGSTSGGGGGGWPGGGNSSNNSVAAKGIKFDGDITFCGSTVSVSASKHEGIEAKGAMNFSSGHVYSYSAADDAINSGGDMTVSGGYVCGHSAGNDGLDANGNCYIKVGVVYAIGSSSPEVGIDANTEENKKLYVSGGTLVVIGGLERGSSLTQTCYSTSSWSRNTWYALTVGSDVYAFKTPSSGGSSLVVSGASTPTLKSGVTVDGGTAYFNSTFYTGATVSGGSNVGLTTYSGGSGGGGGWGGGGGRH